MMRKAGLAKLFCRVCNLSFQKKIGPLDKEVDVYCAWIDTANDVNQKGRGQIGLIGGQSDDEIEEDVLPVRQKPVVKKKPKVRNVDSDEEYKEYYNPERTPAGGEISTRSKPKDPFSASEKIAELGLEKVEVARKVPLDFDLGETPGEKGETKKPTPGGDGEDSDDLF